MGFNKTILGMGQMFSYHEEQITVE